MSFLCAHEAVDPERIALWGDSYSGGEVVVVAACDDRASVVVSQVPVFGAALPTEHLGP